jgi:hypothetical protein
VWSGWVGLGELVGFGVVHPLPGIADTITINTAITLPIGVEAYAMYALSVATTTAPITHTARRFAWTSSVGALALGMAGQVAYHLMAADQLTSAPWPIVAAVSCLPVIVLGFASVLWHLAGQTPHDTDTDTHVDAETGRSEPIPAPAVATNPDPGSGSAIEDPIPDPVLIRSATASDSVLRLLDPIRDPAPIQSLVHPDPVGSGLVPVTGSTPAQPIPANGSASPYASRSSAVVQALTSRNRPGSESSSPLRRPARPLDVRRVREAIAAGDLPPNPSANAIREHLRISPAYARATRDALVHVQTPIRSN